MAQPEKKIVPIILSPRIKKSIDGLYQIYTNIGTICVEIKDNIATIKKEGVHVIEKLYKLSPVNQSDKCNSSEKCTCSLTSGDTMALIENEFGLFITFYLSYKFCGAPQFKLFKQPYVF